MNLRKWLGITAKLAIALAMLMLLLWLLLRVSLCYFLPTNWNQWLSDQLHSNVSVASAQLNWQGLNPSLRFNDIMLQPPSQSASHFALKQLTVTISLWQSLWHGHVAIRRLKAYGASLQLTQKKGRWLLNHFSIREKTSQTDANNPLYYWLNRWHIAELQLRQLQLVWQSAAANQLVFNQLQLYLKRSYSGYYKLSFSADVQNQQAQPLGFLHAKARFKLSKKLADSLFKATIDASIKHLPHFVMQKLHYRHYWLTAVGVKALHVALRYRQKQWQLQTMHWQGLHISAVNLQTKTSLQLQRIEARANWHAHRLKLALVGHDAVMTASSWFAQPLRFKHYKLALQLTKNNRKQWLLAIKHYQLKLAHAALGGSLTVTDFQNPYIALQGQLSLDNVAHLMPLLPTRKLKPKLSHWLKTALVSSRQVHGDYHWWGRLHDFPYANNPKQFQVNLQLNDLQFDYKKPWPLLTAVNAKLAFVGHALAVTLMSGKIDGMPIKNASASMADVMHSPLRVAASIHTQLEKGMQFIQHSPLKSTLGKQLAALQLTGLLPLQLHLLIPLHHRHHQIKVNGVIHFKAATLHLPAWRLWLHALNGDLYFDQRSISAKKLSARLFQHALHLRITMPSMSQGKLIQLQLQGKVAMQDLQQYLPLPIWHFLHGETAYHGVVNLREKNAHTAVDLLLHSQLQGISSQLPAPLAKDAKTLRDFHLQLTQQEPATLALHLSYAKQLHGLLQLHQQHKAWQLQSGHLRFGGGKADLPRDRQLLIDGDVKTFHWDSFKRFLQQYQSYQQANAEKKLQPKVNLHIDQLFAAGFLFNHTLVNFRQMPDDWLIHLQGSQVEGSIDWPTATRANSACRQLLSSLTAAQLARHYQTTLLSAEQASCLHRYALRLHFHYLNLTPQGGHQLNSKLKLLTQLPPIVFSSDVLRYKHLLVKHVHFQWLLLKNVMLLNQLRIGLSPSLLYANAAWFPQSKQAVVQGGLSTLDLGTTLKAWHVANNMQAGSGEASFQLRWQKQLLPNLADLVGDIRFRFRHGRIVHLSQSAAQDVGFATLINLLSFQTLLDRLTVSHGHEVGFTYHDLRGDFHLANGLASTSNTTIDSSIAKITLQGRLNLLKQSLQMQMQLMPYVMGSVPLIATLAAGPLIGAVSWVADKIVTQALGEMTMRYYSIQGSWQKPVVTLVTSHGNTQDS